jgi:hypothetical protein
MKKRKYNVLEFLSWFIGVVVSLAVGFAMIDGTLGLPNWLGGDTQIGMWVLLAIGWIIVVTTLIGVILAITKK